MDKKLKLSSIEQRKLNAIPWLIMILVILIFLGWKVYPQFKTWNQLKEELALIEESLPKDKKTFEDLKVKRILTQTKFEKEAAPFLSREKQIFPTEVSPHQIAKIFELYFLGMAATAPNEEARMKLDSLSVGNTSAGKDAKYSTTSLNLTFSATESELKETINFLQTGSLPERFQKAADEGFIDVLSFNFLNSNLLPVIHINNIKATPMKAQGGNQGSSKMQIRISADMYSQ